MDNLHGLAALQGIAEIKSRVEVNSKHIKEKNTMSKRYANLALAYAVIAMIFGVFYREFTKFSHFTGTTNLSVMHTHYFLLGMFFIYISNIVLLLHPLAQFFTLFPLTLPLRWVSPWASPFPGSATLYRIRQNLSH